MTEPRLPSHELYALALEAAQAGAHPGPALVVAITARPELLAQVHARVQSRASALRAVVHHRDHPDESQSEIAAVFGVNPGRVSAALNGKA